MNWRHDLRIKELLNEAALEALLKLYFQRVYGKDEIQEMERALQNALQKFKNRDKLFEKLIENNENESDLLLKECLDNLCKKQLTRVNDHTPESLLTLSKLFAKIGDFRLACEIIWCSASLSIQNFIKDRQLKVSLHSHNGKRRFARALPDDVGARFSVFEMCHSAFYTNSHDARDVNTAFKDVTQFIQKLRVLELSEEKKEELEKENFD